MINAAIYARSAAQETSIEIQIQSIKEYCHKNNYCITNEYIDRCGSNSNRTEYQAIMDDAKKGIFDVIVSYSVDRITRNELDFYKHKTNLQKLNVREEYVSKDPDTSKMIEEVIESFAGAY